MNFHNNVYSKFMGKDIIFTRGGRACLECLHATGTIQQAELLR